MVLARVLGMPPDQARRVARTFPSMLVTGATRAQAESVAAQLREGGIKVEVVDREEAPRPAAPRAERPVERTISRKSGPRDVREERSTPSVPRHRDAFEERASRTVDVPAKPQDLFEERPSRTMNAPLKHRDMFEERPSRTIDAPPKHRDALEERMAKAESRPAKHRDAHEERMAKAESRPPKHRDAFEERMAKAESKPAKHRDAFEERMSRGDPVPPKPTPAPAPQPAPAPAPQPAVFEERPSRTQPMPGLQDSFDAPPAALAPAFPAFAEEPEPFAHKSGFGALDFDRTPATTPRSTADFGSLDDVFGAAAADTGLRRGVAPKRPTAAEAEVESLFEVPSAGRPVQGRPRPTAPSPEPREREQERGERPAARDKPAALPPMMMSFDEPKPGKRRWLWAVVGVALIYGGISLSSDKGGTDVHAGAAWAQPEDTGGRAASEMHILVRMAPRGIDRSLAMVLRQLVDGLYKVQVSTDGFPDDAQCLLVRGDDGKRQERLEKLLRTGVALKLDEARRAEFAEHQESLRQALGDPKLSFTPLCLSVDAWVAQQANKKASGG
jgi:hypothetical protein